MKMILAESRVFKPTKHFGITKKQLPILLLLKHYKIKFFRCLRVTIYILIVLSFVKNLYKKVITNILKCFQKIRQNKIWYNQRKYLYKGEFYDYNSGFKSCGR